MIARPENNENFINEAEDNIDFMEILLVVLRRKFIVGSFTIGSFIVGALYAYSIPKLWEGNFQIVLSNDSDSSTITSFGNSRLAQIAGISIGGKGNQLKTEVEILKSPSNLLRVFEFVKKEKSKGIKDFDIKFDIWKRGLDIELSRDTSVLNITYNDNDKKIILPVLNKISDAYQEYSGKKRRREIELAIKYLEKEIEKYRLKNIDSLRKEEDFAIANDIGIYSLDSKPLTTNSSSVESIVDTSNTGATFSFQPILTNVEFLRLEAVNKLRNVTFKLERLNNSTKSDQFINAIPNIPQLQDSQGELKKLESQLANALTFFQEDDETIILLKAKKKQYEKLLKENYKNILEAEKSIAEAEIKAAERPKGVITKYKELVSRSLLDSNTLYALENQYRMIELENSKIKDPWELITKPTLFYKPVAPQKKRIAFIFTVVGSLLGVLIALIYDRSKNTIYSQKDIDAILDWKVIEKLSSKNIESWRESLELISMSFKEKGKKDIGILLLNEFESEEKKEINSSFSNNTKEKKLCISNSLKDLINCNAIIAFSKIGRTNKENLKKIKGSIVLQEKEILGLIIIDK